MKKNLKNQAATTLALRQQNRKKLLSLMITKGISTRNDLKDETGFSYSTIGNLLEDLKKDNFVNLIGEADSTGGRKAQLVELNQKKVFFIAIDLSNTVFKWGIYNIKGDKVFTDSFPCKKSKTIKDNFLALLSIINKTCIENKILKEVSLIGIAIPGYYHKDKDYIVNSSYEALEGFEIGATINQVFSIPFIIKNDANIAARNLLVTHEEMDFKHAFFIMVLNKGIGAAIILDGEIYEGFLGYAGEPYLIPVYYQDKIHDMGMLLSPEEDIAALSKVIKSDDENAVIRELFNLKNAESLKLYEKTVFAFASGILQISNLLNPSDIIIGGFYNKYGNCLVSDVHRTLIDIGDPLQQEGLKIHLTDFSEDVLLTGLTRLLLDAWVDSLWNNNKSH